MANEPEKVLISIDPKLEYWYQLIDGLQGTRSPCFRCTPLRLSEILTEKEATVYVVTLFPANGDWTESLTADINDIFMDTPVFTAPTWIATFAPHLLKIEENENV